MAGKTKYFRSVEPVHLSLAGAEGESLALSVEWGMEVMLDFNLL